MSIPADCRFTDEHEWIKQDGDNFKVGISDYAQTELGDVVFVELPEVGREVKKGDTVCNVESVKAVSDVYAPVDGTVTAVNAVLADSPELLNSAPHAEGWLVEISATDVAQLESLKSALDYQSYVEELSK